MNTTFETYYHSPNGKPFQIEHIWADKFDEHRDEFEQKTDFDEYRNRIGDLVLLPQGTNQSFKARPYCEKLKHYVKENLLVRSLCPLSYESGPNFQSMIQNLACLLSRMSNSRRAILLSVKHCINAFVKLYGMISIGNIDTCPICPDKGQL